MFLFWDQMLPVTTTLPGSPATPELLRTVYFFIYMFILQPCPPISIGDSLIIRSW